LISNNLEQAWFDHEWMKLVLPGLTGPSTGSRKASRDGLTYSGNSSNPQSDGWRLAHLGIWFDLP
jgi:hypothetical protein